MPDISNETLDDAIAAMKSILRANIHPSAWNTDNELRDALRAALARLRAEREVK